MNTFKLDGKTYLNMLMGGAASLEEQMQTLNDLNVFPVADGDTGTNMYRTMQGGLAEAVKETSNSIGKISKAFSRGILLSARGNSGVILSQIFAGINEVLQYFTDVTPLQLVEAYKKGIDKAYSAVQNPTEGTILTVFKLGVQNMIDKIREDSTIEMFYMLHVTEARSTLKETPSMLPVLKEAGVVDSGGAGYLSVAEGMYKALTGELVPEEYKPYEVQDSAQINIDSFTRDSILEFGYCTEVLIRLTNSKVDPDSFDIKTVIDSLNALKGESVVAYKQEDIVKVHVHTFTPGLILAKLQEFGEFLTVKIENMSVCHSGSDITKPAEKKRKKFSVVSVSTGDGISALFTHMGADCIINGGQTQNPSAEEFIEAFSHCNSEHILVLPNNKNIILAANQAAKLYTDAKVHVIETKNLSEGYCGLAVITPGFNDVDALIESATRAAKAVQSIEVTKAVRNATINGVNVTKGDYMSIGAGKVLATADNPEEAVIKALENLDTDLSEIITIFSGKDVTAERRAALTEELEEIYDEFEITVYEGGQEIYDYYVAVE